MQIELDPQQPDRALTVVFESTEVPVFRAALQRASFVDTRPEMQSAVFDLLEELLAELPESE